MSIFERSLRIGKLSSKATGLLLAVILMAGVSGSALASSVPPSNTRSATISEILVSKRLSPMLAPDSAERLSRIADRYRDIIASGGFPKVSSGTYKKGSKGKGVVTLNLRLFLDGYLRKEATEGEYASIFTSATEDSLKRFQINMGYAPTGKMDGPTLQSLNTPAEKRLRTIEANIERLRAYEQDLGDRYLVVNVPSQQIETVSDGYVFSRHNAIVGRPDRPTPVVAAALSDINFNPYWNAPVSIVERDILPKLRSGSKILSDMNIKVFQGFGGPEVDPDTVDWQYANLEEYHFRQEPGEASAMATAKINFSSPFGIYLHDTPERQLFKTGQRFYSSGCVRVEKVDLLMEWVLNGQDGIGRSEIAALAETLERRDVKLSTPPQLRVTYLTAWPVGETVAFHQDIYQLDGTGFTVGQPLPVGEVSDDGQRYVLKPMPHKPGSVDAAEADGFNIFGGSKRRNTDGTPVSGLKKRKSLFGSSLYSDEGDTVVATKIEKTVVKKKVSPKKLATTAVIEKPTIKTKTKTAIKSNKSFDGIFDWDAYRKGQKSGLGKKPTKLKKLSGVEKNKKPAIKLASTDAGNRKVVLKKKSEVALATADKKKLDPARKPEKKLADACKASADGKLSKGCASPAALVKKSKTKVPATAVN